MYTELSRLCAGCRVQNMTSAYAVKSFNIFILAIVDGPCEDHVYDSIFEMAYKELQQFMPPSASELQLGEFRGEPC